MEIDFKPSKKQYKALQYLWDDTTEELLYGGAAGGGKSMLGCAWQLIQRINNPGTRGLIGRAKLKNLKATTLKTFFEVAASWGMKAGQHYVYNAQDSYIKFENGSEIILKDLFYYPSDTELTALGSLEITDAFIDEANEIKEKVVNTVKSRIRYKLMTPKLLLACNPAKGHLYNNFYKQRDNLPKHRKFIQALVDDNPNKEFVRVYKSNLKSLDKISRERLLNGNWEYDDDPASLINYEAIGDLWTNDHVGPGKKYITADIARFGGDKTVIITWSGFIGHVYSFEKLSVTDSAKEITKLMRVHKIPKSRVIVDEDGVGGGVVDILKCKGFVNNSKPKKGGNFDNLKSQCYYYLADRINDAGIKLFCEDVNVRNKLNEELEYVKQKDVDKDGKKAILPKDKVKEQLGRSPDHSDAMMMREYFEFKTGRTAAGM